MIPWRAFLCNVFQEMPGCFQMRMTWLFLLRCSNSTRCITNSRLLAGGKHNRLWTYIRSVVVFFRDCENVAVAEILNAPRIRNMSLITSHFLKVFRGFPRFKSYRTAIFAVIAMFLACRRPSRRAHRYKTGFRWSGVTGASAGDCRKGRAYDRCPILPSA